VEASASDGALAFIADCSVRARFATGALAPQVPHPAGSGHLPESAGMATKQEH